MRVRRTVLSRLAAAALLAAFATATTACGDEDETAGPDTGADVEDVTDEDYFGTDQYVGENVTVSAEVTEVISPTSFELAGQDYGDESLLVVSAAQDTQVQEGDVVQLTGTVQDFSYGDLADQYGLAEDQGLYDPYTEENVLVAETMSTAVPEGNTD